MTIDIKNFYLGTPMKRKEYMRIRINDIPQEIIDEYKLSNLVTPDGWIYIEISRGMYGLPQSGIIAQEQLEKRLEKHGYKQSKIIPGFWTHEWRPISFTLVVDDFGVKYVGREHAEHLLAAIKEEYECTADWNGNRYIGLTLDWDYRNQEVHLSMPGYIEEALIEFDHPRPKKKQDAPFPYTPPKYGQKIQYAEGPNNQPELGADETKFIQRVVGKFNFIGRAVDSTMITALSGIAVDQAAPTEETMQRTKHFLDYVASQEDPVLTYRASDMILAGHSDAGYLNKRTHAAA